MEYGKLIENPNIIKNWTKVLEESIKEYIRNDFKNPYLDSFPENLYGLEEWCLKMDLLIENAKTLIK